MSFLLDHCCGLSRGQIIYDCRLFAFLTPAGTRMHSHPVRAHNADDHFVTFVQYNVQRRVEFAVCKSTRLIFLTFHHVVGGEQERKIVGRIATFNHPLPLHSFSTFTVIVIIIIGCFREELSYRGFYEFHFSQSISLNYILTRFS